VINEDTPKIRTRSSSVATPTQSFESLIRTEFPQEPAWRTNYCKKEKLKTRKSRSSSVATPVQPSTNTGCPQELVEE
jgi:hypothetical protein